MTLRKATDSLPHKTGLSRRGLIKAGLGLTGVAGLMMPSTAAFAAAEAANDLIVTNYRLSPPGWRQGQRLTITVIADIHAGGPNMGIARVREVVDAAQALKSDLIVVLGDYFATHRFVTERVPPAAWSAELARLSAPLGVYAILGNHDWWYGLDAVRGAFANDPRAADGKRRRAARQGRRALLACRLGRSARALHRAAPTSRAPTICPARSPASPPTIR